MQLLLKFADAVDALSAPKEAIVLPLGLLLAALARPAFADDDGSCRTFAFDAFRNGPRTFP